MNRLEVLVLSAWFVLVVAVCVLRDPWSATLGAAIGLAASVPALPRLRSVRRVLSARLGDDLEVPHRGVRWRGIAVRVAAHLGLVVALAVVLAFVPLAAGRVLSAAVAALTVLALVLTAAGRRGSRRLG